MKFMRKLKLYIACSLDGKIARKNGAIDWLPDPSQEDYGYKEFYDSLDSTVMGYKTYEVCRSFGEWVYPDKKTYVFSRDPSKDVVAQAQLILEEPVSFIKKLKERQGRDIWLVGGGEIIRLLHDAALIDEYIIAFIPVVLGEGLELFPGVTRQVNLSVTKHMVYSNGVGLFYYERR
jgi:dihydrofolate reductase